jgi:hypothetical protein
MLVAILKVLLKRQGQCSLFVAVITASAWNRSEKIITEFADLSNTFYLISNDEHFNNYKTRKLTIAKQR